MRTFFQVHDATVTWSRDGWVHTVRVDSAAFEPVECQADDAFEALCRVRDQLDPQGWRLGVAGAQIDVWPSGMARDQGGGLRAYRVRGEAAGDLVDTFGPVDPSSVVSVAEQQEFVEGHYGYGPMRGPAPR